MQKSNKYSFQSRVRFSEVDHTKRITLPAVINYFQDCSTFQSEDIGYGFDFLTAKKRAWILSSWQVVVERYPKIGEEITVSTWATGFKGMLGQRNFCMEDKEGRKVAYANSLWVYMDTEKGRPVRPDQEETDAYGIGEALSMDYASRKIALPENAEILAKFPVRKYHIDTNEHVNNCQYVQMAMEVLPDEADIRQVRVEYKKSAVYGDRIVPKIAVTDERTVVELCDEAGSPFAIAEFVKSK
ncbi:acyl-[acyl-carrier-protein] thioesterase [Faecalicatena contorta]|uniref:acyl-[acyl-carrier-protein] thioesterase n=1 Tax=Faecalicatena contorta TaxID=39482 RepID=UPI001F3B547F|nr:acyl-ACP thioesterase domain-containing protein [Faecalicatena contorta]MCF2554300.1 acyl-[acyl-carrier-protein] thioesterase [Faecalicatena contorta]MCF2679306.1 acyl-[acyl-carrier-protein] thioesterase [Faecalicatena contorta]